MEQAKVKTPAELAMERLAANKAKERARVARWDLDVAVFLFAVLIIVIILLFQDVDYRIVAAVAIFGLAMVWVVGSRRGNQLYAKYYEEELTRLMLNQKTEKREKREKTVEETIEEKVQKAFLERFKSA